MDSTMEVPAGSPNIEAPRTGGARTAEEEAKARVKEAMEAGPRAEVPGHRRTGSADIAGHRRTSSRGLLTKSATRQSLITDPVTTEPTLTQTTEYLKTLHEGGTVTDDSSEDEERMEEDRVAAQAELDNMEPEPQLADATPLERVVMAAELLKDAANIGTSPPDPEKSASSAQEVPHSDDDLEQPSDEEHHHGHGKIRGLFHLPGVATRGMRNAFTAGAHEWSSLNDFFKPKGSSFFRAVVSLVFFSIIPCIGTAAILFYATENLPTGRCKDDEPESAACTSTTASASWWILFLGVRQVITWLLGRATDVFMIDFMVLQHPMVVRVLGPRLSLMAVQSKGWPSILFWWAIWDLLLLFGSDDFSDHWLFWQDYVALFTEENPAGEFTSSDFYRNVIISAVVVSLSVCIKRHMSGLHLGARLHARYNDRLKESIREILIVSELAIWARNKHIKKKKIPKSSKHTPTRSTGSGRKESSSGSSALPPKEKAPDNNVSATATSLLSDKGEKTGFHMFQTEQSDFTDFSEVLVEWEDPPETPGGKQAITGNEVIEFRQAFSQATKPFFFSSAFGPVSSRNECIKSAELLYRRLLKLMGTIGEDELLDLDHLTQWMYKGCNKPEERQSAAALVELLLPDSDGYLSLTEFVTAIDAVYRKLRALESAVKNHSHIDKSYEKVINIIFFFVMGCVVLAIMGVDPFVFILSVSSFIVAFAFMIGPGVSQQFEGILLVLVRQPYDIGDRVAIADPQDVASIDGSGHWLIQSIDLVTTTAKFTATGEVATFSNGSLARCRLINMNRSPEAVCHITVRFTADVPYSTIMVFREAVENFVQDRPQEWISMLGFRAGRVESQLNYVEYAIWLQHRCSWQEIVPILVSKAALSSYCVEVQKELGCRYQAPSMGVEITMAQGQGNPVDQLKSQESAASLQELAKQFPAKKDD